MKSGFIIGSDRLALQIAEHLVSSGMRVTVAEKENAVLCPEFLETHGNGMELLTDTCITGCTGTVGNFLLHLEKNDDKQDRHADIIIIAERAVSTINASCYGLEPSSSVIALSQADRMTETGTLNGKKILFITGVADESRPDVLKNVMESALCLIDEHQAQVYIITGNLKVGANGLEALYRKTRKAGAVYVKVTDEIPDISRRDRGDIRIEFTDEVTRQRFGLSPDITVIDENMQPSDYLRKLSRIMGIQTDAAGFAQADNVHRLPVFTNRKGIFVAGQARGEFLPDAAEADADNVSAAVFQWMQNTLPAPDATANLVDTGGCAKCLTCFRSCPYGAIVMNARAQVMPDACEGCGICAAECPRGTIYLKGVSISDMAAQIRRPETGSKSSTEPFIVAYCCSRSAVRAIDEAIYGGYTMPEGTNIVEVPCGGAVSFDHLLTAFKKGADGVLVLTCHNGNCHSEIGSRLAVDRAEEMSSRLGGIGIERERIRTATLASNMSATFIKIMNDFKKQIDTLGSSRLGKQK